MLMYLRRADGDGLANDRPMIKKIYFTEQWSSLVSTEREKQSERNVLSGCVKLLTVSSIKEKRHKINIKKKRALERGFCATLTCTCELLIAC